MSKLPKKQVIQLNADETIQDRIQLHYGNTLIRANTGAGKTTFVLKSLMRDHNVVLCCPTIAQVKQCEEDYGHQANIHFIHGEKSIPKERLKNLCKSSIVITYDQYDKIKNYLDQKTVVVIDECQKLYSAGNYRDKAIYPLLSSIKNDKYDQTVLLTATLTEPLFEQLGINISHYSDIQKPVDLKRIIHILRYKEAHKLNGLRHICTRLSEAKKEGKKKIVLVRLNDIAQSKLIQKYLEKQGYSVMLINRDEMSRKKCTEMLSVSKLDSKYQVVLCTSIMDEAINLNNVDDEVDSVHIMGQYAHPEEITQFIGRMRKANPPIFIHLSQDIEVKKIDCNKEHQIHVSTMDKQFKKMEYYLEYEVLKLINKDKFEGFEDLINDKMDRVKAFNALTDEVLQCKGFMLDNKKICLNTPSLAGRRYQLDLHKCYFNSSYLKFRLLGLMPHAQVKVNLSQDVLDSELLANLELCAEEMKQMKQKVIPEVIADVIDRVQTNSYTLISYLQENVKDGINLYDKSEEPVHYEIFEQMGKLSDRLGNIVDIADAIQKNRINSVMAIGFQYKMHPLVKSVMKGLEQWLPKNEWGKNWYGYAEITKLMNSWLKLLAKNRSVVALLEEHPLEDVCVNEQKQLVFTDGGSIRFLKQYANVQVRNDKKPYDKKKVRFNSLGAYGYVFSDLEGSFRTKYVSVNNVEYDAKTGRKKRKRKNLTEIYDEV